jgi:hypothetical protein
VTRDPGAHIGDDELVVGAGWDGRRPRIGHRGSRWLEQRADPNHVVADRPDGPEQRGLHETDEKDRDSTDDLRRTRVLRDGQLSESAVPEPRLIWRRPHSDCEDDRPGRGENGRGP